MAFQHGTDIDPDREIDLTELDKALNVAYSRLLKHAPTASPKQNAIELLKSLVQGSQQTHKSIRALCRTHYATESLVPDAYSLTREQVERIFIVTLLCVEPERWTLVYLRDSWRKFYLAHLHEQEETAALPRFREFNDVIAPVMFQIGKDTMGITDDEKLATEHEYSGSVPPHLKKHKLAKFPSPGSVKDHLVGNPALDPILRWHKEYQRLCEYSHSLLAKVIVQRLALESNLLLDSKRAIYLKKETEKALFLNHLSMAYIAAEVFTLFGSEPSVADALYSWWDMLREASLLGNALWEMRVRHLLPTLIS